jgi:hypothetical protein
MSEREAHSEYLWSGRGEPDADIAALERALAPARLRAALDLSRLPERRATRPEPGPPALRLDAPRLPTRRAAVAIGSRRWAMAAMVALATTAALVGSRPPATAMRGAWAVELRDGSATIGDTSIDSRGALRQGQWLVTGEDGAAHVRARGIGTIDVQPRTRVRLAQAHGVQKRLELASGTIDAFITSPPRVFLVDTPAGRAIDMGCMYTLRAVDGQTELSVSLGYVILESGERSSTVPAGAACTMRQGMGPGLPLFADASEQFRNAAFMFDVGKDPRGGLETILATARPRDAMTLWHLLQRVDEEDRGAVFDALERLDPPPAGVTRAGAVSLNAEMLGRWWNSLRM